MDLAGWDGIEQIGDEGVCLLDGFGSGQMPAVLIHRDRRAGGREKGEGRGWCRKSHAAQACK